MLAILACKLNPWKLGWHVRWKWKHLNVTFKLLTELPKNGRKNSGRLEISDVWGERR
jgi:hypothetical protein